MGAASWALADQRIRSDHPFVAALSTPVKNLDSRTVIGSKALYPWIPFPEFIDVCLMRFGHARIIPFLDFQRLLDIPLGRGLRLDQAGAGIDAAVAHAAAMGHVHVHSKGLLSLQTAQHSTLAGKGLQQGDGCSPMQVAERLLHALVHRHDRLHAVGRLAEIRYVETFDKIHGVGPSQLFSSQKTLPIMGSLLLF